MVNKFALMAGIAALSEQAVAMSAHRRLHMDLERRALAAESRVAELEARDVVTVWTYKTVTVSGPMVTEHVQADAAPAEAVAAPAAAPSAAPAAPAPVEQPAPKQPKKKTKQQSSASQNAQSEQPSKSASSGNNDKKESSSGSKGSTSKNDGSSPFGCKRGFAYTDGKDANAMKADCPDCCWGHDWADVPNGAKGFDFVPTCWGKPDEIAKFPANARDAIKNGAKALFSFNEPDIPEQADMTPTKAAQLHKEVFAEFADSDVLIGSPSISNSGEDGKGLQWLDSWADACGGSCAYDFCNLHWYTDPGYGFTIMDHIKAAKESKACADKPLWITEFNINGNDEKVVSEFIAEYIPKLDDHKDVQAYAFFLADEQHLLSPGGGLSAYGKVYASA